MNVVARPRMLDIGIGGSWVRLHTDSPDFVAAMAERFAGFIGHVAVPDHEFDIELMASADGDAPEDEVRVERDGACWRVRRGDFVAQWDPRTRRGHARLVASPYSLDSVIRILHTLLLAENGGMLMHASSVAGDGKAWVFTGVSGVGKTTISRLAPPGVHVLTDEMSFIRRDGDGYIACGTPFSGELARPGENLQAPLAGVFLLAQGAENRIDALSPAEAVRGLMANILYFARDEALTAKVFDNAIALAARVPVRRLTFLPDPRVWDLIGVAA
jgi:hypothetical protein